MESRPSDLEPPTGARGEEAPATAAVADAGSGKRWRGLRQTLIIGLSVLALLCLGGGSAAFLFYNKATKPDLSTPALVTRTYLSAYFVDRDDVKAGLYECRGASGLDHVRALRDDLDNRARTYNVSIAVSVDSVIETSRSKDQAEVAADIVLSTTSDGTPLRRVQHWQFTTRNDGGWRVCSGHEVT
jgi:hypothetical protein